MSEIQTNHDKLTALARDLALAVRQQAEGGIGQTAFNHRVTELSKSLTSVTLECYRDYERSALEVITKFQSRVTAMNESGIPLEKEMPRVVNVTEHATGDSEGPVAEPQPAKRSKTK